MYSITRNPYPSVKKISISSKYRVSWKPSLQNIVVFSYQIPIRLKKPFQEMLCSCNVSSFSDNWVLNWDLNGIFSTKVTFVSHSPAGQGLPLKTHLGFYFSNVCNVLNSWVSLLTWNTLSLRYIKLIIPLYLNILSKQISLHWCLEAD